ncbi:MULTISPECIES: hypothetical protein [unclassified Burkholderia]|uniref:hypothetical protein n=1 Tax=unclassified Burkholderia TaxID=2613784 RepID=UPI00214F9932|nr:MULTISPECIES: hypothetical protein [unclassified Burkholderia]MCR4469787.1 hypothetical protein [Burkholderia sp. SCN-KJ]
MSGPLHYVSLSIDDLAPSRSRSTTDLSAAPYGVRSTPSQLAGEMSAVEKFVREWKPVAERFTVDELGANFEFCDPDPTATTDDGLPELSLGERVLLEELSLDSISALELWHRILGTPAALTRRANRTDLMLAVEQFAGRLFRQQVTFYPNDVVITSSLVLVKEFARDTLREMLDRCRDIAKQCAAARASLRRRIINPAPETGSAAAIAKRLNPLGAPPQFA